MIAPDNDARVSRRRALAMLTATATATAAAFGGDMTTSSAADASPASSTEDSDPTTQAADNDDGGRRPSAEEAWRKLVDGNARFVAGEPRRPHQNRAWRESLLDEQHPFATVLSCADSRVPPELLFDQGFGDLFTIRCAGEVLDAAVIGSVEYGVEHLGTPLVVVLGHSGCGAVRAAIDAVRGDGYPYGDVAALVHAIEPAVRSVPDTPDDPDDDAFVAACVEQQARRVADALPARSSAIRAAVQHGHTRVVAAVYDLTTGTVTPK
ncbi:carbonic anhydrase [Phytoactinopolyspora halotolerans]|uniref:carbonic anhydrase n=1 Tax=Phytoactinopolyspora halotolerans TaxID=1981512 RepID=A0A6L9SBU1_9ACTN|nr:carbonic anhydrase [Phytoactinopolyspora halotolerans]NEE02124.1 carbonic anhydrase [Phytoactinopolyspora halotolerans]